MNKIDILEYAEGRILNSILMRKNVEEGFLWWYRRQYAAVRTYSLIEPNNQKMYGEMLAELDQTVENLLRALKKTERLTFKPDGITISFEARNVKMTRKLFDNIISKVASAHQISLDDETKITAKDKVQRISAALTESLARIESSELGKYGETARTVEKRFLQSLFPYFRYLRAKYEDEDNEELYRKIIDEIGLIGVDTGKLRLYFSDKKNPAPLKLTIEE